MTEALETKYVAPGRGISETISEVGRIVGVVAMVDGVPDRQGDTIAPGAFSDTIARRPRVPILIEHKGQPVGFADLRETEIGLEMTGQLDLTSEGGRKALARLRAGDLSGLSWGFKTLAADQRSGGGRVLRVVDVVEVTLTRNPAQERARVLSVKSVNSVGEDMDALAGEPCWLGVDLSSNSDLTAVVACWRVGDGYAVAPHFFCPAENLRRRADRDGVPYPRWAAEGFIEATPGNVVDFRSVEDCIRDLADHFNVVGIGVDPHLARNLLNNLTDDGYPAVEVRQGWVTMAPAIKELERAIVGRQFQHGGHPVLRWCFGNIEVETDRAGNRLFSKGKARDRIDGAVATAIAVSLV